MEGYRGSTTLWVISGVSPQGLMPSSKTPASSTIQRRTWIENRMLWRQRFETMCGLWIHWVLKPEQRIACGKFMLRDPRGDFFPPPECLGVIKISPQTLAGSWMRLVVQKKHRSINTLPRICRAVYTKTLGCEGCEASEGCERVRLWPSLRCLFDHVAWRDMTALSHWSCEGSRAAISTAISTAISVRTDTRLCPTEQSSKSTTSTR